MAELSRENERLPVPDPSVLTTEQLRHEIAQLSEQFNARILGMEAATDARLSAMDKATALLNDNLTRVPTDTEKAIKCLEDLHDERFVGLGRLLNEQFSGVEKQFKERDERVAQSATQVTLAVAAALQAQKEAAGEQTKSSALAINKSESNTKEQIDGIKTLINTTISALAKDIAETKDRLTRSESTMRGGEDSRASQHSTGLIIVAALSVIGTFVSTIIGGVALIHSFSAPVVQAMHP